MRGSLAALFSCACLIVLVAGENPYASDPEMVNRVFSTSVFKRVENWAVEGYFLPHETLRRDFFLANRILQGKFDPQTPWHARDFYNWYKFELLMIHGHHKAEEDHFFPAIVRNAKGITLPERLTADHGELLKILDSITILEPEFEKAKAPEKLKELGELLKTRWNQLTQMMQEHLDEEENILIPVIKSSFTQESYDVMVQQLISDFDPWELIWELPAFLSWFHQWCNAATGCPPDAYEAFRSKIPAPLLFATENFMLPRWEDAIKTLHGIETGIETPYSRAPRPKELLGLGFLLLLVVLIFLTVQRAFRRLTSKPKVRTD